MIDVARAVSRAGGRLVRGQVRRKGFGDFVTTVDIAAERRLRTALTRLLPESGFLGEESKPSDLERDWVWVVDPIDGTSNFTRGLPHHAVAVALMFRGQPMLASIHAEPDGVLYSAVAGHGARRDGRRLRTPRGRLDDGAMFGCQWHRPQVPQRVLRNLQRDGARIRLFGSTVVQLLDVAAGRLDGNVQQPGRLWDLVAPGLVLLEAGARFTDWHGEPVFPIRDWQVGHTPTLAAPGNVHPTLLRWVASPSR